MLAIVLGFIALAVFIVSRLTGTTTWTVNGTAPDDKFLPADDVLFDQMVHDATYKVKSQFAPFIYAAAAKYRVPYTLLDAIIAIESSDGRNTSPGAAGEIGVMQITPNAEREIKATFPETLMYSRAVPSQAIAMAAGYLQILFKRYGNWKQAAIAYNSSRVNELNHPYYLKIVAFFRK